MTTKVVASLDFTTISVADLIALTHEEIDTLKFGVVGLTPEGLVEIYNQTESTLAGLPGEKVIGAHFFLSIAQCMNNFLVAQRFEDENEIDSILDYVLTFRMRPTPVKLHLLKSPSTTTQFVLIQR